jgi:hypothetical protein
MIEQTGSMSFLLCFRSLFQRGRGYAFPCDGAGRVNLDDLSDAARNNYLYARAMVGRELSAPAVEGDFGELEDCANSVPKLHDS